MLRHIAAAATHVHIFVFSLFGQKKNGAKKNSARIVCIFRDVPFSSDIRYGLKLPLWAQS